MEYAQATEIDTGDWVVRAVTFTENGEYLVSCGNQGVQVWRVKDGEQVANLTAEWVQCIATSKDGRFIAGGSAKGSAGYVSLLVWDATKNYEQVFADSLVGGLIYDIDFSPVSPRLVAGHYTATIWDIAKREKVQALDHNARVLAAKYSSQGNRIATATRGSVQVWDSNDGRLLVNVKVALEPENGLWFTNCLFVKTVDSKIMQIDPSTGSTVSQWTVPNTTSWIAMPPHANFIAYSTEGNISLWDTSTHIQLGPIRSGGTGPIAFSTRDQIAIVAREQKVTIRDLALISELDTCIDGAVLRAWKMGQLTEAEALLTAAILRFNDAGHHVLASRALVRARLQQWDAALMDAEESINIRPSALGYIAKCTALVGKGGAHAGCSVWDIASLYFHSEHVTILLIKAVVLFIVGEYEDAISRIDDLVTLRPLDPTLYVVQAYMHLFLGNLHMESANYNHAVRSFKDAQHKLGNRKERPPSIVLLISGWEFDHLATRIQQRLCEGLLAAGRTKDAGDSVRRMVGGGISEFEHIEAWVSDFVQRCLSAEGNHNESHHMTPLLREWARLRLSTGSWKGALASATNFAHPKFIIYQAICEHLEITGLVAHAVSCYRQMCNEKVQEIDDEGANWTWGFKSRCSVKLVNLGDIAMNAKEYDVAILQYTTALSLTPDTLKELLSKRSKAHACKGEWEHALNDADEIIKLDPSSLLGHERKHEALHGIGRYDESMRTYEAMLSKMLESSDPKIRERSRHYVKPDETKETIRTTIGETICDSPLVLIDTISGRLCNKSEQAAAFETTPAFSRLISSMITHIDHTSITNEVGAFYRYVTFSHKWEENEPLFETVIRIVVYDLEKSPAHEKLQMFCKLVREAGFNWAWSDTCCINKGDHFVLQEALVSMFKWYERSAMTFIFLRGVPRLALRGALTRSIWNMRAWTLQEYHASKVVRIYTEDWTPYLGLDIYNHKDSPEVISEMEEATGISARALMALRPGLDDIREKLRLASMRQTTRVEDAAYSLLGIFSLSLPITYGEGDKALGRLLSQLLASSGDMSILAWTGKSGSFNSCLPSSITVFSRPPTSHIPLPISNTEMGTATAGFRSVNLDLLTTLYDRVSDLPVPSFSGLRMKLPCLAFKLGQVSVFQTRTEYVFRAQTNTLGVVEIRTKEDLSKLGSLHLAHPWIDFLLDRLPVGSGTETTVDMSARMSFVMDEPPFPGPSNVTLASQQTQNARRVSRTELPLDDSTSLLPPSTLSPAEKQMRLLHFAARLRQPFGALLLAPTRRNIEEYRRVAAESQVMVQVKELTPVILNKLINSVRVLDVL